MPLCRQLLSDNELMVHANCAESEKPSTASLLRREPRSTAFEQEGSQSEDGTTGSVSGAPHLVGSEIYKLREDGHKSCFEEARLSRWKMPQDQNAVSPPRSSAEKAMLIEKSLNMFQSKSGRHKSEEQSPLYNLTDKEPSMSSMSRVSSLSSMDEPPAFACTMPSSQFSMNGEETVAIKKCAEELITLGADPNARSTDIGGHQGLIDQTINTKECLSDILSMFNRPLACEKPQRKARTSNTTSRPEGFEVFVDDLDDGLDVPRPPKLSNKNRAAFEIFNDEENDPRQLPDKKGFEVFVDEEMSAPLPPRIRKPAQTIKKPFQVLQNEEFVSKPPANKSFEVFVDEDIVEVHTERNQVARPPARKPAFALSPGLFQVFADDDIVDAKQGAKPKIFQDTEFSKPSKGSTSGGSKAAFQVYADDEDPVPAPRNVDKRIPKSKPVSKPQDSGFSIFVDDEMASSQPVRKPKLAPSTRRWDILFQR